MFRAAQNRVKIEGILSEIDLKYLTFNKNGVDTEAISGSIKVLVEYDGNEYEIPVHMFSPKYTKAGKSNPSFESIEKIMKEYVSIAAIGDKEKADKIRITNGQIKMNEFYGQNGHVVSSPRIYASFVQRVTGEFAPEATFTLEFMVSSLARVTDKDGVEVEPAKLAVQVVVPQWTAEGATALNVDAIQLIANSQNVINAVESNWEPGYCYKANGRLNFTSRVEEVIEEVDFGEPQKHMRTINVSELVITGGTQSPLDAEDSFTVDEIKAGMAARKERLERLKDNKSEATTRKAPEKGGKVDLGF